jgi:hypothetical protein
VGVPPPQHLARLAQSVAHLHDTQEVVRSIRAASTTPL